MTGFLARLALACALMIAVPAAPGFAMGRFNQHGSLQRSDVHDTPEIDAGAAQGAVALVVAGLFLLADRRRR
jgi:hypothetical protein